jgi:hypothetical protein
MAGGKVDSDEYEIHSAAEALPSTLNGRQVMARSGLLYICIAATVIGSMVALAWAASA